MHKNAIKLENRLKVANFPQYCAKNLANLAINWKKIGDFWQKSSANTDGVANPKL